MGDERGHAIGVGLFLLLSVATASAHADAVGAEEADRHRIREHLQQVERDLRARDVSHLTAAQREARERNLDRLHEYHEAGVFPRNDEVPGRTPVFIDGAGRECAMGHLILRSGAEDAARTVAAEENLARVVDIQSVDLGPWLARNGMTLDEAQRVQPNYCFCDNDKSVVCGEDGVTYFNECVAETCRGVGVAHDGPCEEGERGDAGAAAGTEPVKDCVCSGGGPGACVCGATGPDAVTPGSSALGQWLAPSAMVLCVALVLARRRRHPRGHAPGS